MRSTRLGLGALAASLIALCSCAQAAMAGRSFRPRIGGAMGILPSRGHQDLTTGTSIPVVYHGGLVMHGVTVHTIFWAPNGFRFDGPPSVSGPSYEQLVQQFFTDVAHDSGSTASIFSVLRQYPDRSGPGSYSVSFSAASDSIDDTNPYPAAAHQCASPAGVSTCITDLELRREIERVIRSRDPTARGLHHIWVVFLPPDVDTCVTPGQCASTAFAGYHSVSSLGHGPTIYVSMPDPLLAGAPLPGASPEGDPEAESAIDGAAHELIEAITDPEGAGWLDPNGFEVGDKCESGPQYGTPLGFAPNGSPYNGVINGNLYLTQMMWSNAGSGCKQRSAATTSALPLATVSLKQFSPFVVGNLGIPRAGVPVAVLLARAQTVVALAQGSTDAHGNWGPVALRSVSDGKLRAVGDDRDEILIRYGPGGPPPDLIQTGNGGNPFGQAGWTGWFALDHGYAVSSNSMQLSPCSQTGVLDLRVDGASTASPLEQCETESDVATISTKPLREGTALGLNSEDNRAVTIDNPDGALVTLEVALGEPRSVSALANAQVPFDPTGFPLCTADLRSQTARCDGLVPRAWYLLSRRRRHATMRARADDRGAASFGRFRGARPLLGGDVLVLANRAHRTLTALHVAHLRVDIKGDQTVIASGRCQPGDYYGPPIQSPPVSAAVGLGVAGNGVLCPDNGSAAGMSAAHIVQIDDASGGQTRTEVPLLAGTSPVNDGTVYGPFTALAQTALPGPNGVKFGTGTRVALTITSSSGGGAVFSAPNVNTHSGVAVSGLTPGVYLAKWVVTDINGDTRTVKTRFVEQG